MAKIVAFYSGLIQSQFIASISILINAIDLEAYSLLQTNCNIATAFSPVEEHSS